jgi:hypothetical protein
MGKKRNSFRKWSGERQCNEKGKKREQKEEKRKVPFRKAIKLDSLWNRFLDWLDMKQYNI